ncbi:hypothetical protein L1286_21965 [Pseudoalteromonas sp. SMS1]|uniref:hypothetical protein n=1 Tax=Pseudoalteromonas sp. SMS1 TaxID=2908894 RepID=UPI001F47759E|nr:hypothetical protein [Pseudoalteromonas sp. SMS1]MCF2860152.1 hypothetical protein [Pseudoalteromonas sp. SMS1]
MADTVYIALSLLVTLLCCSAFAGYERLTYRHYPITHTFCPNALPDSKQVWVALPQGAQFLMLGHNLSI